jgi:hypothetical protein
VAAKVRKSAFRGARLLTMGGSPRPGDYLHFRPAVTSAQELADLSARVNWYLPDRTVPIYVDGPRPSFAQDDAPHMDETLVHDPGWASEPPQGRALNVYWRLSPATMASFVARCRRAEIADPELFFVSDFGYARLRDGYAAPVGEAGLGIDALMAQRAPEGSAFVLATGPSAQLVDPETVTDDVRITCNSAVRDRALIRALRPTIIAFNDPVFHYGPSRYAAAFRADLRKTADECDAQLVTSAQWAKIILAHDPVLKERITVLRSLPKTPWHFPDAQEPWVHHTGNVLTNLLLPIAFSLASHVRIAGCDGRQPQEGYFWKHNQRTQYGDDLMTSAFDAHPAFFRDRDYEDYYEHHCRELEELLATGEAAGRTVEPVTPSWIPALTSRGAPSFPTSEPTRA